MDYTLQQLISIAMEDIKSDYTITRWAVDIMRSFIKALGSKDMAPSDHRTTGKLLAGNLGIRFKAYDCCVNSCVCYTTAELLTAVTCPKCQSDRYDKDGHPIALFLYLPVIPRLLLQYAIPQTAQSFTT